MNRRHITSTARPILECEHSRPAHNSGAVVHVQLSPQHGGVVTSKASIESRIWLSIQGCVITIIIIIIIILRCRAPLELSLPTSARVTRSSGGGYGLRGGLNEGNAALVEVRVLGRAFGRDLRRGRARTDQTGESTPS